MLNSERLRKLIISLIEKYRMEFCLDSIVTSLFPLSPAQSGTEPAPAGEHQPESGAPLPPSQRPGEEAQADNLTSTPEKAPPSLAPLQLAQLRSENADSFDMEEVSQAVGRLGVVAR